MPASEHPRPAVPARDRRARDGDPARPIPPPGGRFGRIRHLLDESGQPAYQFAALIRGVRDGRLNRFDQATNLPRRVRDALQDTFGPWVLPTTVIDRQHDTSVEKVLFRGEGAGTFETVCSRFRQGWASLCVSSQAGCGLGCTFCATGAIGLTRNLSADEIFAQAFHPPWRADPTGPVRSVAFMGMGEALANPHTVPALRLLTDPDIGGLARRRITVSTVGFAPQLERLVREFPRVSLTLSVHSPFADQRAELIPLERRFPLEENLRILTRHVDRTRRKVYLAYLLIAGVNDTAEHARALGDLVTATNRPDLMHVSVLAYNPASGADPNYRAPSDRRVRQFVDRLHRAGVRVTRRQQFGREIEAACGQLHADKAASDAPNHRDLGLTPIHRG